MSKKVAVDIATEQAMKKLGELIRECRGSRSLRKIAEPSSIPASQLLSIENGTMAPTADVYPKLLNTLQPEEKLQAEMDQLYMTIRKTPPPDVCELIINNQILLSVLRKIGSEKSTEEQIESLLTSFLQENVKGVTDNG